jgi:hypothetical protein
MEEDVLPIRAEDKAEALAGIVPLNFGLDGPGAALFVVGKHVLFNP